MNHISRPQTKKAGLDVTQSHPLHRMCFNQYHSSSAACYTGVIECSSCNTYMYQSPSRNPVVHSTSSSSQDSISCNCRHLLPSGVHLSIIQLGPTLPCGCDKKKEFNRAGISNGSCEIAELIVLCFRSDYTQTVCEALCF